MTHLLSLIQDNPGTIFGLVVFLVIGMISIVWVLVKLNSDPAPPTHYYSSDSRSWFFPGPPFDPTMIPEKLSDDWTDVGFTTDDGTSYFNDKEEN